MGKDKETTRREKGEGKRGCEEGQDQAGQREVSQPCDDGAEARELGDTTSKRSHRGSEDGCEQQPEMFGSRPESTRELGDTKHDGSSASGNKSVVQGKCGRESIEGQKEIIEPERASELANSSCEGLQGSVTPESTDEEGWEEQDGPTAQCCCPYPARPGEPQRWWEAPRTISKDETSIITPVGCPDYGVEPSMVLNQRTESLRALGNGVVPSTAERAFIILMGRLGAQHDK